MKIGILTFHKSKNFGSALQVYALSKILKNMGHKVCIVDYIYKYDYRQYNLFRTYLYIKKPPALIVDIANLKRHISLNEKFNLFYDDYLELTDKTYYSEKGMEELNNAFDCFICGSDQIWNLNCTNKIAPPYFLSFADENKLKVAFAPSMPKEVDKKYYAELKRLIERLDYISVRENKTVDYLKNEVNIEKNIEHISDPTLLLTSEDYIKEFELKKKENKYIFVYMLGGLKENKFLINEVLRMQKKTGYDVYYVWRRKIFYFKNAKYCLGIGPIEFLDYIYNAEYIITDSFHATVFSLIFGIKFYVFPRLGSTLRMKELLEAVGLPDNMYSPQNTGWDEKNAEPYKNAEAIKKITEKTKLYLNNIFG